MAGKGGRAKAGKVKAVKAKGGKAKAGAGSVNEKLLRDVKLELPKKYGRGYVTEYAVQDIATGKLLRYSLAFINPLIFAGDNGRVLGYDDAHGRRHKHYFGVETPHTFASFEDLQIQFQSEWQALGIEFVATQER